MGRDDVTGADWRRERDRSHPLAKFSTLNRMSSDRLLEIRQHHET